MPRVLLLSALLTGVLAGAPDSGHPGMQPEDAIHQTLLELRAGATTGERVLLVGSRATLRSPFGEMDRSRLRALLAEAGASTELVERSNRVASSAPGPRRSTLRAGQRRVESSEIEAIFSEAPSAEAGWNRFFDRHPDASGYLHLSPLVWSEAVGQAGVVETFVCGVECGETRLLLLEERDQGWVVMAELPVRVP